MLLGLRGVGKTVLLNRIDAIARDQGYGTTLVEAPENKSLPDILVPPIRQLLFRLSRGVRMRARTQSALRTLRNFASAFSVSVGDLEVGVEANRGVADSGNLEMDLTDLWVSVAEAAEENGTAVVLLIDEVQYLRPKDLAALIVALHRIRQRNLPLTFFGAGLPQLAALAGEAKSYAERLFDYPDIGPLDHHAARAALQEPVRREAVEFDGAALDLIVEMTEGYPYFIQEWGAHAWDSADQSPISVRDVRRASDSAIRQLDHGFFRVRYDRLTPREKTYMRAMAELGSGPRRSGEVAAAMGVHVRSAAPIRQTLIRKGMLYSPAHGDVAFTVPMFDAFMKRRMPYTSG